jgi:hypothetical protein
MKLAVPFVDPLEIDHDLVAAGGGDGLGRDVRARGGGGFGQGECSFSPPVDGETALEGLALLRHE